MNSSYHIPVLFDEVLSGLQIQLKSWYIDCTLGGGGYAVGILAHGGRVVGIDVDLEALAHSRKRFIEEFPEKKEGEDWILVHDNFRNVASIGTSLSIDTPQGIIMDLGVSSHQLDDEKRGFSYRYPNAPFDLRLNQTEGLPAYELINTSSKETLYDILTTFGEEERALSIAHALFSARHVKPINTIDDVLKILEPVLVGDKISSLSRIFQAFRIAVNDELQALKEGLQGAEKVLPVNGRLLVISFHSLEDRIVKNFLRNGTWNIVQSIQIASEKERMTNRRSRSAKLRIGEKK